MSHSRQAENHTSVWAALYAAAFCVHLAVGLLIAVISYYAEDPRIGASPSETGLVWGMFSLGTALALLPFGFLSDRFGRRRFLVVALIAYSLVPLLYPATDTVGELILVRVLNGLAFAAVLPPASALLLDLAAPERRGLAVGGFGGAAILGIAVGPFVGDWLLETTSFTTVFHTCALVSAVALFLILLVVRDLPRPSARVTTLSDYSWEWLKRPMGLAAIMVPFLIPFGSGTIVAHLPSYTSDLDILDENSAGPLIAVMYIGSALGRVLAGWASDRVGRKPVIPLGFIVAAASLAMISSVDSSVGLGIVVLFFGLGMGIAMAPSVALLADVSPTRMRGFTMGMHNTALSLGLFAGPAIMGSVLEAHGYDTMFSACALVLGCGLLGVSLLLGSKRNQVGA